MAGFRVYGLWLGFRVEDLQGLGFRGFRPQRVACRYPVEPKFGNGLLVVRSRSFGFMLLPGYG